MNKLVTKKIPSALPIYAVGGLWLLYALFFPLYRFTDYLLLAALSLVLYIALSKVCKPVEITEEAPVDTGDSLADKLISEGLGYNKRMILKKAEIDNPTLSAEIQKSVLICEKIFDYVAEKPETAPQVRRFVTFHMPTVVKMLESYERMEDQPTKGENITQSMTRISDMMTDVTAAYAKQLDALFAGETMDIGADMTVLETMFTQKGISNMGGNNNDR